MERLVQLPHLPEEAAPLDVIPVPGFASDGVTWECFTFSLRFMGPGYRTNGEPGGVYITRADGRGLRFFRADSTLARALFRTADPIARHFLCLTLTDTYESRAEDGARAKWEEVKLAFVEGRLKKRKMPGRAATKVWIEPRFTIRAFFETNGPEESPVVEFEVTAKDTGEALEIAAANVKTYAPTPARLIRMTASRAL